MPNLEDPIVRRISAVALDAAHPFSAFAKDRTVDMGNVLSRYGIGAIVTGGQTGTDSAGMAIAQELGIPMIGFAPRGYISEEGPLSTELRAQMLQPEGPFSLCDEDTIREQEKLPIDKRSKIYAERTELNAKHSSATLVINPGELTGGTLLTVEFAHRYHHPSKVRIIDPTQEPTSQIEEVRNWIRRENPLFLNIAGPRQSHSEQLGINVFEESLKTLRAVLA